MRYVERSVEIGASAEAVWRVLSDTAHYPDWNPFIVKFDGPLREGTRITVALAASGARPMTFRPTLLKVDPQREIRWLGKVGFSGLFAGEHDFQIQEVSPGRVRFVQSEKFSGLLVPLFRSLVGQAQRGFEQMNAALKSRVEGTPPVAQGT